jgi:hypothetical protein
MVQYEEALLEVYRWVLVEIVHDAKLEGQLDGQDRRQSFIPMVSARCRRLLEISVWLRQK